MDLPADQPALRELVADVDLRPLPELATLPEWCGLEKMYGEAPVQAEGALDRCRWYFRARHDSVSLSVSTDEIDPVDTFSNDERHFYVDEQYGVNPDDASYIPEEQANFFILREMERACEKLRLRRRRVRR